MPFFDAKYLVVDGARISEDDVLNQKQIKTILPYNDKNEFVLTLTEENHQSIDHINVVFTDDTTKQYQVKFKNMIILCFTAGTTKSNSYNIKKTRETFGRKIYFCITINPLKSKLKAWNTLISLR